MAQLVDWDVARQTGARLVPAGPAAGEAEARELVAGLRAAADTARGHVRAVTHLDPPEIDSPTLVVDRPSWIRANCESMSTLLGDGTSTAVAARAAGWETGAVLALLAPRILGQFDPFHGDGGRLLLVAPNVLQIGRQLDVGGADFALWVCLHEETHRVQFHTAPWLRDYLRERIETVLGQLTFRFTDAVDWVRACLARDGGTESLLNVVVGEEHRRAVDEVAAVMTLLEGHADVMMDRVGPGVVGGLHRIRSRFEDRREGSSGFLGRLLGMDAKRQQYRQGAAFCRAVIARRGVDGLNHAFRSVSALPTMAEIRQPDGWLERVCRRAA